MTPEHTRLTTALRELKTRTGLSLAALAERTAYSKSSWERYLNGKAMPPRKAIQDLCRTAHEPDGRLLALWEIAEAQWSRRAAGPSPAPSSAPTEPRPQTRPPSQPQTRPQTQPQPRPEAQPVTRPEARRRNPGPKPSRSRKSRLVMVLTSVYAMLTGGVTLALLLLPDQDTAQTEPISSPSPYILTPRCHDTSCEGQDPIRMVCSITPHTLTTYRTTTGAHIELRYSNKCSATWARIWGTQIGDQADITADGPTHETRTTDSVDADTYIYTQMTAARPGSTIRTCFHPATTSKKRECFNTRIDTTRTNHTPTPLPQPTPNTA
ncbi:DUF2690 domain-containing protein [Streptomyces shenzhenensis]|uniref:helix-turn-helix domain-containing protein n=1 Tax=Streptomyces shenzhenensis TaxID=943815 RepID=UPI00381527E0